MLALADAIVVTQDSISMVSEAVATPAPVLLALLPGSSRRGAMFTDALIAAGRIRPFAGRLEALAGDAAGRHRGGGGRDVPALRVLSEDSDSLLRKTAAGTGWIIGWRMATRLLGVVSTLVLVHLLVPADFGLVALGTSFTLAIEGFAELGVEEAVIRHPAPTVEILNTGFTMNALRAPVHRRW